MDMTDRMCEILLKHKGEVFAIDDLTPDREAYDMLERKRLIRYRHGVGNNSVISAVYTDEGLELYKELSV